MSSYDVVIVGQGVSGSFLSWQLIKQGMRVLVLDNDEQETASSIASGVINPITGRRYVKTWMIDELLLFSKSAYNELEQAFDRSLLKVCETVLFHSSLQNKIEFEICVAKNEMYCQVLSEAEELKKYFNFQFGVGKIQPCYVVNAAALLEGFKNWLLKEKALLKEHFDWKYFDYTNSTPTYKHIRAARWFFCEGAVGTDNPIFGKLPFACNKGETILASIPNIPTNRIYKFGSITLSPYQADCWWIGSTYTWDYSDILPTSFFLKKVEVFLNTTLKVPYNILNHKAALRPATIERRPFVGFHPQYKNLGILNGMGAKGFSLAPYFAKQLGDFLCYQTPIEPLADIGRFDRIMKE